MNEIEQLRSNRKSNRRSQMSTALRLAECLDTPIYTTYMQMVEAAAELRRLHAQRDELLATLSSLCSAADEGDVVSWSAEWDLARAAIAKAEASK